MQIDLKHRVDEHEEDSKTNSLCVGEPPSIYPGES